MMIMFVAVIIMMIISLSTSIDVWKDLSEYEMNNWYTPTVLCMLKSEDKTSYPQVVRSENCSIHSKGDIHVCIHISVYSILLE